MDVRVSLYLLIKFHREHSSRPVTDLTHSNAVATDHTGLEALVCKLIPVSQPSGYRDPFIY